MFHLPDQATHDFYCLFLTLFTDCIDCKLEHWCVKKYLVRAVLQKKRYTRSAMPGFGIHVRPKPGEVARDLSRLLHLRLSKIDKSFRIHCTIFDLVSCCCQGRILN